MKQLSLSLLFLSQLATSSGVHVQVGNTIITGRGIPELGQEFFGGIPFAKPPVGPLRLKPPIPQLSLDSPTFDATQYGAQCMQPPIAFPPFPTFPLMSEDCLTLDIQRPAGVFEKDKLPVMVWIFGGGFEIGSGQQYNGSTIVSRSLARGTPILHVSLNYRLGALGFPQGEEAAREGALNLGMKDQLAALEWVQHNIGAFGGDPSKVTLFGESAGATSISTLSLNPSLSRLARGAILHSGIAGLKTYPLQRHQKLWSGFVSFIPECASLASTSHTFDCLRNVSASTILDAQKKEGATGVEIFPWNPVIDGQGGLIPDYPSKLFKAGHFAKIPFIAGTNLDEGTLFSTQSINSSDTIREWILSNYTVYPADIPKLEKFVDQILPLYPDNPALGSPFRTGNGTFGLNPLYKKFAAIVGDLMFQSYNRYWLQTATEHGVTAYGYLLTNPVPSALAVPALGVYHTMDLPYLYPDLFPGVQLDDDARKLSEQIIDYWVSFATSLDPNDGNGSDRPKWPLYTQQNRVLIELNRAKLTTIPDNYREKQIEFINEHAGILGR